MDTLSDERLVALRSLFGPHCTPTQGIDLIAFIARETLATSLTINGVKVWPYEG